MATTAKTLLLTGFGLWGDEAVNTSWETVTALEPELPTAWTVVREQLPVEWVHGPQALRGLLERHGDSIGAVVCFGMCRGNEIRPERLAINLVHHDLVDAREQLPRSVHLMEDGPPAYWTGFDYPQLVRDLKAAGLPTVESHDAGGFLCNAIFYTLMHERARLGAHFPAGFIHLPHFENEGGLSAPVLTQAAGICVDHAIRLAENP